MNWNEAWAKALKNTEIIRARVQPLLTFEETRVPYILLCESSVNIGDTVVRKGEVNVQKPSLILPPNIPFFDGFEFNEEEAAGQEMFMNFLLVRGVSLPTGRYNNTTSSLDIYEGPLDKAVASYQDQLQSAENVHTGLLTGPEDCWQFSILIYVCAQILRNSQNDIRHLMRVFKERQI